MSVLELVEEKGRLDEVQEGLVRILNFSSNWWLREQALVYARRIERPSIELLEAILCLVGDQSSYLDARILAAQTLTRLAPRLLADSRSTAMTACSARRILSDVIGRPEPPILRHAVEKAMQSIAEAEHPNRGAKIRGGGRNHLRA